MIRIAVVITVVVLGFLQARPTWHKIVVRPQIDFNGVVLIDPLEGWSCGMRGWDTAAILHSVDGGLTWTEQLARARRVAKDIDFSDSLNGWAVGHTPLSAYTDYWWTATTDGGLTWRDTMIFGNSPSPASMYIEIWESCRLLDADIGWCAGHQWSSASGQAGTIAVRSGAYQYWGQGELLFDVDAVDSSNAWAAGEYAHQGLVVRTTDGGRNWSRQIIDSVRQIVTVDFLSRTRGIAVGSEGMVLRTTDGGDNWTKQQESITPSRVAMVDTLQAWIVGGAGTILHTTDGGSTWFRDSSGTTVNLSGVSFVDSTHGWAVGDSGVVLIYCDSLTEIEEKNDPRRSMHDARLKILQNPATTKQGVRLLAIGTGRVAELKIYDVCGKLVRSFPITNNQSPITIRWDACGPQGAALPPGIYFVQLKSGGLSQTARVVLID